MERLPEQITNCTERSVSRDQSLAGGGSNKKKVDANIRSEMRCFRIIDIFMLKSVCFEVFVKIKRRVGYATTSDELWGILISAKRC